MAHLEREPHRWCAELWMAAVGPVTSLLLGLVFTVLGGLVSGGVEFDPQRPKETFAALSPLATLLFWLGPINIILGLFNLVPGFPLDGGRVLRAVLWGISGNLRLGDALGLVDRPARRLGLHRDRRRDDARRACAALRHGSGQRFMARVYRLVSKRRSHVSLCWLGDKAIATSIRG